MKTDKINDYFSENNSSNLEKYVTLAQYSSSSYKCNKIQESVIISMNTRGNNKTNSIKTSKQLPIGSIK